MLNKIKDTQNTGRFFSNAKNISGILKKYPLPLLLLYLIGFSGLQIALWINNPTQLVAEYGHFFFLGMIGAVIANSTGAGGGIVFIPFFDQLGFSSSEAVGTSMAIQCFGMTAGAIGWWYWLRSTCKNKAIHAKSTQVVSKLHLPSQETLNSIFFHTIIPALFGLLLTQYFFPVAHFDIGEIFRWFSICLGALLLIVTFLQRNQQNAYQRGWKRAFIWPLWVASVFGGAITAWLSVGIGEILALTLFFMRFHPSIAVAIGVILSSLSVITGITFHIQAETINVNVVIFAAQAALIGGYIARHITQKLGNFWLKIGFAVWIIGTGVFMG